MSKTPYEIRLELLSMAQGILTEQLMNERIRVENTWNMKCEQIRSNAATEHRSVVFPDFPNVPSYSSDQVIAMAEKLNAFVSNN